MRIHADNLPKRFLLIFKRGSIARTLFFLLLLGAVGWSVYRLSVPHHNGKSIGYWVRAYQSLEPRQRKEAVAAFQAMAAEAVPYLIKELEAEPSTTAVWYQSLKSVIFRRPRGYDLSAHFQRKSRAADILGDIGPAAEPAVPELEAASKHSMWYVWTSARAALIKIRGESPAPFIEELRDTSDPVAWYPKAMLLAKLGTNASAAVPLLLRSLQHSNEIVIGHALIALGKIQSSPELCVPAITPFLTNGGVSTRQKAFFALLRFPSHAAGAAPAVIAGLSDPDPWTRCQALKAVNEVLSSADQGRALPQCEALLNDPSRYVRKIAREQLPSIRAAAK